MKCEEFFDLLFPGDETHSLPSFSDCVLSVQTHLQEHDLLALTEAIQSSLLELQSEEIDVNELIKTMQRSNKHHIDKILTILIDLYFSSETVIKVLRPDAIKLFPNHRSLDVMDYSLLFNVANIKPQN